MTKLYCVKTPFQGWIQFETDENGLIDSRLASKYFSPKTLLTPQQFIDLEGSEYSFLTSTDFDNLREQFNNSMITNPVEISEEDFDYFLDILPPCRWANYGHFNMFHVSERLSGNIVSWFVSDNTNEKFYRFDDNASLKTNELINKMENI